MNELKSEEYVSLKACDNMNCGVIQVKGEFRRCSHCQRVFYCSTTCQRQDWATGGHRDMCHSIRISRLKNPISTRDLSFMRSLFANDASEVDHKWLCSRLSSMRKYPGDPILHTVDYTHGYPKRYIGPLEKERARDKHGDVYWDEHVARAARSGGRMELHLMGVWDGNRTRRWMFPRRSHRSTLHNGLIRILNDIHPDDACEEVEKLLEENGDVVQIHP
ncbi:MYND-type domain-containing protein [Mycena venus]|uniref:MYND-type domain-containing protein n=1 Tax=Mycena venus TaxID=2733690 RepID=A0A8H6XZ75_9AGAR|nr:MYND-type domain-containing protein [Mycena venus]